MSCSATDFSDSEILEACKRERGKLEKPRAPYKRRIYSTSGVPIFFHWSNDVYHHLVDARARGARAWAVCGVLGVWASALVVICISASGTDEAIR